MNGPCYRGEGFGPNGEIINVELARIQIEDMIRTFKTKDIRSWEDVDKDIDKLPQ
jgi:hypothetical protein